MNRLTTYFLGLALAAATSSAGAAVMNGLEAISAPGGSNSASGLTSLGDFNILSSYGSVNPDEGSNFAMVTTSDSGEAENVGGGNAATSASIAALMGVTTAVLDGHTGGTAVNGGAFSFTFSAYTAGNLSFDWIFLTDEDGFSQNDVAVYAIYDVGGSSIVSEGLVGGGATGYSMSAAGGTGAFGSSDGLAWQNNLIALGVGDYRLTFGVLNAAPDGQDSALLVDDIQFSGDFTIPTPIPGTAVLLGLGLLGLRFMRRAA
ncbi:MAG: hypothetical protein ACPGU7_04990 [Gammaproteobacteria bacterium]